jgi:single-strand DNA-binding protein
MNNLNQILIDGDLTIDPKFKHTEDGAAICNFSAVLNRSFKQDDDYTSKEVPFSDITAWSSLSKQCDSELLKGSEVSIIGRLKKDRWQDEDGKNHSKVNIIVDRVVFKSLKEREKHE